MLNGRVFVVICDHKLEESHRCNVPSNNNDGSVDEPGYIEDVVIRVSDALLNGEIATDEINDVVDLLQMYIARNDEDKCGDRQLRTHDHQVGIDSGEQDPPWRPCLSNDSVSDDCTFFAAPPGTPMARSRAPRLRSRPIRAIPLETRATCVSLLVRGFPSLVLTAVAPDAWPVSGPAV